MKAFSFLAAAVTAIALSAATALTASAQQITLPLWPHGTPEPPQTTAAETNLGKADGLAPGAPVPLRISNVTQPTITVTAPAGEHTRARAAALVFPGGGYIRLAMDIEGEQTCKWLNSIDMVCLLVKYRVPEKGYYPENSADLEDAQQAMRLARSHASEWHIDPARIGVIGFSAGGNLAVLLATHPDDSHVLATAAAPDVPTAQTHPVDARANFLIAGYPAYLAAKPEMRELLPQYTPNSYTPPTFIVVAEDDRTYGPNSLVLYRALLDARVPAELHAFPSGGHGFGTFPAAPSPEAHWTELATAWLRAQHILPD